MQSKRLWERSLTAIAITTGRRIEVDCVIGVGDASHRSFFVLPQRIFVLRRKKWSGFGKELLTSADNYILSISDAVPPSSEIRQLILAAVLCIDMVLKE